MRYVAAYLLATLGGKASPNQNDIEKILSSVGIESDTEKLKIVLSELNGKSIDDILAQGLEKLSYMPVGGAVTAAEAAPAAGAAATPAEEKKEEKKPVKEEFDSDDDNMGFSLFD